MYIRKILAIAYNNIIDHDLNIQILHRYSNIKVKT